MADEFRFKKRDQGPLYSKTDEVTLWAHDDGSMHVTDEDGSDTEIGAGGGGSQPVQATYFGGVVVINDGESASLPFGTLSEGTELLDRTTPDEPTFLDAGTYALTAQVATADPLTSGGFITAWVSFGATTPAFDTSEHPAAGMTLTAIQTVAANDACGVHVTNHDGAASCSAGLGSATLVKLA